MDRIRAFLRFTGKSERKVVAVFAVRAESAARAVGELRRHVADLPVRLFTTEEPWPETAGQCESVTVDDDSMALLVEAQKQLWPYSVALSMAAWTGESGGWPLKLAPFLVPPFRAVFMNRNGDLLPPEPGAIFRYVRHNWRDAAHSAWNRILDWRRGVRLWFFAQAARHNPRMSRRAFEGVRGSQPLEVPVPEARGEGVAVYRYSKWKWDGEHADRFVRESECRRILFLEGGAQDDLPWIDEEDTFAVTRQAAFRGWKDGLLPLAPFRRLQPEEISHTLAPVSPAILVDRARLAALGVPRSIRGGTAWLLLFWKAAAAGWKSYSVGSNQPVEQLHDWPYEEAEFVTRILADPALQALGPRDPDLALGSIARPLWPPSPAGRAMDRPRVLVVSPYLPYPHSHGGAVRIYNLCRALSGRVDFLLACFREKEDVTDYDRLHEIFREVWVVDRDEKAGTGDTLPAQVREHVSRSMRALIAELAPRIDVLQVEYTHMAAFRDAAPRVPAILVEHDLTFSLYRQLAERDRTPAARNEYERWLAFERRWFQGYDAVWTMSELDRVAAIAEGSPAGRTLVVANGVDLERFAPCDEPTGKPEVLYVGSFRHLPNLLGFEKLLNDVMPDVWARFPETRLRVVAGPDPERYWRELLKQEYPREFDARILMHAFVADLRPLYARAAVVVVPLELSAGTNIKVMEAMACRKAVVSTPVGVAGLELEDGRDVLIRAGWREFADAVAALIGDAGLRERIAGTARSTTERRFGWQAIAGEAYANYAALAGVKAE